MKLSKKVLVLLIQIFVVALALIMTVSTYAWYTSNTRVDVAQTTVQSAAGANTEIISETSPEFDTYMGQDGTDKEDNATYYVDKNLRVTFTPLSGTSAVQINFVSIAIAKAKGGGHDSSNDDTVIPSFTWRLLYDADGEGENPALVYQPDENGFAYTVINGDPSYITVTEAVTMSLTFRLIYLDDESYQNYLEHSAEDDTPFINVTPFRYSGYDYMRSTFTVTFEIGVDQINLSDPGEGGEGGGE